MKQVGFFTLGAIVPATLCVAFSTMVLNHCDGKFGCVGTLSLLFKASILPIAFISSMTLIIIMYTLGKTARYQPWVLSVCGGAVSLFNLVSFQMAQDYGLIFVIVVISVLTAILFVGLSKVNLTTK